MTARNSKGFDEKMENPNGRGGRGGLMIMEFRGHGGITHFGNSEGKGEGGDGRGLNTE